jgi:hypothetical protein
MTATRTRLATLAAAAGYGPDALALIADAALPWHRPGDRLDDSGLAQVASAVEVLAQCGYRADVLPELVDSYRLRYRGRCWREPFWRAQLRIAAVRFNHPRFYGLSPCEADPARLAAHAGTVAPRDDRPCATIAQAA